MLQSVYHNAALFRKKVHVTIQLSHLYKFYNKIHFIYTEENGLDEVSFIQRRRVAERTLAIGLCLAIISGFFFVYWGTPWGIIKAKKESTIYLEATYGEEFHVKIPKFWIMDGTLHAEASPLARPELIFVVGTEQRQEGITDSYVWESWRYEGKRAVEEIVTPHYKKENVHVEIDHPTYQTDSIDLYAYQDYTKLSVIIDVRTTTLEEKLEETVIIFQLLTQLARQEIPLKSFSVWFENEWLSIEEAELLQLQSEEELLAYWESQ